MHSSRGSLILKKARSLQALAPALIAATVIAMLAGCASNATSQRKAFTSIDNATNAVQAAVRAYKRKCGVGPGEDGPGTCSPFEYAKAEKAYAEFQKTALGAVDIAQRTGQTTAQVVSDAALLALGIYDDIKRGTP